MIRGIAGLSLATALTFALSTPAFAAVRASLSPTTGVPGDVITLSTREWVGAGPAYLISADDFKAGIAKFGSADGIDVSYRRLVPDAPLQALLSATVPLVLVAALGCFAIIRLRGPAAPPVVTGSPGRVPRADRPHVTFSQVAGAEEAKQELGEIVEFLRSPRRYRAVGARVPHGVLLVGPPGTGKTLLARAVAGQAAAWFLSVSGSEFVEMYAGMGAARVRALFSKARSSSPCIVFVDEIDAVGRRRQGLPNSGSGEHDQTLNQLLVEMDGFETDARVIVMAATNRPDILDPALLRPGRFDRHIRLDLPDADGRRDILAVHTQGKPLDGTVDLEVLARQTSGFSGADLASLANEAAILAARAGRRAITRADMDEAFARVAAGACRNSRGLTARELAVAAYHEAGHALVMLALPGCDEVHSVSIGARGRRLGLTVSIPADDRSLVDRSTLANQLAASMAGRVAEQLVFGDVSTAGEDDIAQATRLARHMVTDWGMSERIGPVATGTAGGTTPAPSGRLAALVDAEVAAAVRWAVQQAGQVLERRRRQLDLVAERLLEAGTIDRRALDHLLEDRRRPWYECAGWRTALTTKPALDAAEDACGERQLSAVTDAETARSRT